MNRTGRNGSRKRPSPYVTPISLVEALEPRTFLSGSHELGLAIEQFIDSRFGEHHELSPTPLADLTGAPAAITAVAGVPFAGDVATLDSASKPVNLRSYRVTIDWGDGTPITRGFPRVAAGGIHIPGYHRYQAPGNYAVTVTLTQYAQGSPTGTPLHIFSSASVTQNSPSGLNITANTGIPFTGAIGSFSIPATDTTTNPATFKAFINWGDHAWPSPGTLTLGNDGIYDIFGGHTYASPGTYRISVFIMKEPAPSAAWPAASPHPATTSLSSVEPEWDQLAKNHIFVTSIFSTATVTTAPPV